jgi:hypothetical protein
VPYLVNIRPEVVRGVQSFFPGPRAAQILDFVGHYLAERGDEYRGDRWNNNPDDFFIYQHTLLDDSLRLRTLEFVVRDTGAFAGVLEVTWVERYPDDP